jgi:Amt family ammonium transporter
MEPTQLDMTWLLFCAALVFLMQLGFLCLESGLTRSKNNINVATKNLCDFGASMVLYWAVGFGVMFGASYHGWFGLSDFALDFQTAAPWRCAFYAYQAAFCGAAVTILSGAVAERMVFHSYLFIAVVVSALIYPVAGHWAWNGFGIGEANGWLAQMGFIDFAGSTVVHSVGGWVAVAALLCLGPRAGRFDESGAPKRVPPSNLPMATLGVLTLWVGWIGFNGGSTLALNDAVPAIIANSMLAGGAGLLVGVILGRVMKDHFEIEFAMNGALAGLVAITANCFAVSAPEAAVIGAVGGAVMVGCTVFLEKIRMDDAVGAIPVHLAAGAWGTLAVGIFGDPVILETGLSPLKQIGVQALGIAVIGAWSFCTAYVFLRIINTFSPLRVTPEEEHIGLNVSEHGARTDLLDLFEIMDAQSKSGNLSLRAPIEPFTEIGRIAARYNHLMGSLEIAVDDLTKTTAAKERMESELSIGRNIQMSMLPLMFPIFPKREEFSVFATVQPAREVGGDYYDIFMIDKSQLCICIGDVSGKGVPAALFMAVSKTLIKSKASREFSTATVLNQANAELSRDNKNCMFVTLFLAILDINSGTLVYTNAGHNPPYIRRTDGTLETLDARHGPVIGIDETIAYKEARTVLAASDTLLLYTDGVTEASDKSGTLYGTEKLERLFTENEYSSAEELVHSVLNSVKDYESGVEQADDITAMALQYLGVPDSVPTESMRLSIHNQMEDISTVVDALQRFANRFNLAHAMVRKINVVLDDLLNNTISYAYSDDRDHLIDFCLDLYSDRIKITIADDGIPFNPFAEEKPDLDTNLEDRVVGGLGIHLVRNLVSKVGYQRQEGKNVVTLVQCLAANAR